MFIGNRQRAASRNQFRLFVVNIGHALPVPHDALDGPMLFHPDATDSQPNNSSSSSSSYAQQQQQPTNGNLNSSSIHDPDHLKNSYKMFSSSSTTGAGTMTISPSPTRSMIKEANDHLQLLHHRVTELERTVQEQAEALIKKDEQTQTKLRELGDAKDAKIRELSRLVENHELKVRKLEHQCREKDAHLEMLAHKCGFIEELSAYTPILDRLVSTLKKLPHYSNNNNNGSNMNMHNNKSATSASSGGKSRSSRNAGSRGFASRPAAGDKVSPMVTPTTNAVAGDGLHVDGHVDRAPPPNQALADLRIGRSFSINQNFSMSEDEAEDYS